MTQATDTGITVAGTTYVPATHMGFARYGYIMGHAWTLDLSSVKSDRAMLARVFERGLGGALLAGFYVPEIEGAPQKWGADQAAHTAAAIDSITDVETMNRLLPKVLEILEDFFPGVASSSAGSATSSDSTATIPASTSEAPMSEPKDVTHSASSASSSEPSPATT